MFVVIVTYKKPLSEIDAHLKSHREYLDEGYARNILLASGPQEPRKGGILLSQCSDRHQLEEFLRHDPFSLHDLASYDLIEFVPVKHHPVLAPLLK